MGNIAASAKVAPPPDPFKLTPELMPEAAAVDPKDLTPAPEEPAKTNPGSFEELPRNVSEFNVDDFSNSQLDFVNKTYSHCFAVCVKVRLFQTKEVIAKPFEGCKFTWNKMITDRFQATHTINMSSFKPATYKFGTTYVGSKKLGPNEQYPILIRLTFIIFACFTSVDISIPNLKIITVIGFLNKNHSVSMGEAWCSFKAFTPLQNKCKPRLLCTQQTSLSPCIKVDQ